MAHIVWKMLQPRMNRFWHFAYIHWWYVLVLLLIQTLSIVGGHPKSLQNDGVADKHGQRFAMEPQDQTAIVGSRVTLPCRVIGKQGTLQWTKDDFGLGWHRNLSGFERYTMIGSDEEGDFSLGSYAQEEYSIHCLQNDANDMASIRSFFIIMYIRMVCIADIYPVMLDDDARYQCQVGPGPQGLTTFFILTKFPPLKNSVYKYMCINLFQVNQAFDLDLQQ